MKKIIKIKTIKNPAFFSPKFYEFDNEDKIGQI